MSGGPRSCSLNRALRWTLFTARVQVLSSERVECQLLNFVNRVLVEYLLKIACSFAKAFQQLQRCHFYFLLGLTCIDPAKGLWLDHLVLLGAVKMKVKMESVGQVSDNTAETGSAPCAAGAKGSPAWGRGRSRRGGTDEDSFVIVAWKWSDRREKSGILKSLVTSGVSLKYLNLQRLKSCEVLTALWSALQGLFNRNRV